MRDRHRRLVVERGTSAAIAPAPTGTAFCIASATGAQQARGVGEVRLPAAASAEYSPSEWPATKAASRANRETGLGLQHAQRRDRNRHQRGLGIFGELEGFGWPFPDDARSVFRRAPRRPRRIPPAPPERLRQGLAHADGLRTLPGKVNAAVIGAP